MKLVSVIIPSYQSEKWISKALNSCLEQEAFVKEIIVIDDHSTDRSWDIASGYQSRYPQIIKVFKNKFKGGNNARNYGFEKSEGEYIQWLDADDQVAENKFYKQLSLFQEDPAIGVVFSDWKLRIFDENGNLFREQEKNHRHYDDFLFELLINNWSPPLNYLVKRSIAEKLHAIKAWNPDTQVAQDREYFTLAALIGAKFGYVPGYLSIYNRWNRNSVSAAKKELRHSNLERILNRFLEEINNQNWLPEVDKIRYRNIISTEKCLLLAYGFPANTENCNIGFPYIYWPIVRGYRTTLKLILAVLKVRVRQRFHKTFKLGIF